ncbi:hypothetical protein [Streptomyces sp. NPDC005374]|uniref:hypothetical protein n=1 Tax=Streptomyces sp. NPDC005374 TaxID=3364713 RepID=UPI0036A6EA24
MDRPAQPRRPSRREAIARARQSRRPSRLGSPAGSATGPDRAREPDAGFPGLLKRAWEQAEHAPDLVTLVQSLLTLGGHVPSDIQLRALSMPEECALKVLCGLSWREGHSDERPAVHEVDDTPGFHGAIGLTTSGRIVIRLPSQPPLADTSDLVGGIIRVPWPAKAVADYQAELDSATVRRRTAVADCRRWLETVDNRDELLEVLKQATLRTAPVVLYQGDRRYTNFRERNNLPGKTLWPGHPDCALTGLQGLPLELWSDNDAELVVCLILLVRSAGFGRIEESNGTQLSVDHIADLLERARRNYESTQTAERIPPASSKRIEHLNDLAGALRSRRTALGPGVQLYREIHGPLMHKIERVAGPPAQPCRTLDQELCSRLRDSLPVAGSTLAALGESLADSPDWLIAPHGGYGTGQESLIHTTVAAAVEVFGADFAMSRGMRSLPRLIKALREQDWQRIVSWDLPEFFCCVVPDPAAIRYFGGSTARLADVAWSMSARMQYNSWHFLPGGLPPGHEVDGRDYFVPPTMPDIAYFSDQHHHGHIASRVRFSIRSPQAVTVLDRTFNGFVDVRLLRCEGRPFDEQELLAAHRVSGFISRATTLVAELAARGANADVTSFDPAWHWVTTTGGAPMPGDRNQTEER